MVRIAVLVLGGTLALGTSLWSQTQSTSTPQSGDAPASNSSEQNTQTPTNRPEVTTPDSAPPNAPSASKARSGQKSKEELEIERKEQSQKMLGVIPQYSVTSRHDAPPLTPSEKFHLMLRSTVNPFEFVATGLQAGLSQAENQHEGYGQGAEGFGKRYGAALADQTTSNFFSNFAYPVIFKQDPRYFRLGEGTFKHRLVYSLEQEFSALSDTDRHREFNYSNVLGAFTSGAISNAYYPQQDRGLSNTLTGSAIALIYGSVGGIVDEFWPDVHDKWKARHDKKKNGETQQ